jgi:hypothetical protein
MKCFKESSFVDAICVTFILLFINFYCHHVSDVIELR